MWYIASFVHIDCVVKWLGFYGPFARTLRVLAKPFADLSAIPDISNIPDPVVFVGRHRNLRGPIFTMMHLPREVHPWVYCVFCDKKSCFEQYTEYTFSVRMGLHRHLTLVMAWLLSRLVPKLIKSLAGIPVYRKSLQVKKTFAESLECLKRGESVIIYPDVDYTSTDNEPGKLYSGFVLMGELYKKATGQNLQFVPLDVDMGRRALLVGNPITFDSGREFNEERTRVAEALRGELAHLGAIISGLDRMTES